MKNMKCSKEYKYFARHHISSSFQQFSRTVSGSQCFLHSLFEIQKLCHCMMSRGTVNWLVVSATARARNSRRQNTGNKFFFCFLFFLLKQWLANRCIPPARKPNVVECQRVLHMSQSSSSIIATECRQMANCSSVKLNMGLPKCMLSGPPLIAVDMYDISFFTKANNLFFFQGFSTNRFLELRHIGLSSKRVIISQLADKCNVQHQCHDSKKTCRPLIIALRAGAEIYKIILLCVPWVTVADKSFSDG